MTVYERLVWLDVVKLALFHENRFQKSSIFQRLLVVTTENFILFTLTCKSPSSNVCFLFEYFSRKPINILILCVINEDNILYAIIIVYRYSSAFRVN